MFSSLGISVTGLIWLILEDQVVNIADIADIFIMLHLCHFLILFTDRPYHILESTDIQSRLGKLLVKLFYLCNRFSR